MKSRHALMRYIADHQRLSTLLHLVRARISDDPGHDLNHALRVALWTVRLGGSQLNPEHAIIASLLHDIVNVPKDSPQRSQASELCANEAAEILAGLDYPEEATDVICDAIRDHSYSRGATPTTHLGRCLQDADRLEALGAIGVFRTISTGVVLGADYFHGSDPWAKNRSLDDVAHTVDHFFVKLLKLASSMCTDEGRAEAERRSRFMEVFLTQLGEELGEPMVSEP
jgi:uncharacterized protein